MEGWILVVLLFLPPLFCLLRVFHGVLLGNIYWAHWVTASHSSRTKRV